MFHLHRAARAADPRRLLLVITAAVALGATPAGAATWTTRTVPLPASAVDRLASPEGSDVWPDHRLLRSVRPARRLLAWDRGIRNRRTASVVTVSDRGDVGQEHRLPHAIQAIAADARGGGIAIVGADEDGDRLRPGLWATAITPRGRPGPARRLSSGALWEGPQLAVNDRGDAVVAWLEGWRLRLRVAVRRSGQAFGPPVELGRADPDGAQVGEIAVAIDSRGRTIVAYGTTMSGHAGQALAWVAGRDGDFGPVHELGRMTVTSSESEPGAAITAAFDGRGRGFVAWGGPKRASPVSYASLAPASSTFTRAVTVDSGTRDRGTEWSYQGTQLVAHRRGGATIGWRPPGGGSRVARIGPSGRVAGVQRFSSDRLGLIGGPGDRLALVAARPEPGAVRLARAGSPFGSAVALPSADAGDGRNLSDESFDARGHFRRTTFARSTSGTPEMRIATLRP